MQANPLQGNELMSCNNQGLSAGGTNLCFGDFYHYYPVYYPQYHYVHESNKIEQSFKIVGKLIEKDLIEKELSVKQFMKLVNEIAEIL